MEESSNLVGDYHTMPEITSTKQFSQEVHIK
jgi:hypothetical protein